MHRLREENQALRDEVARLKGQKPRPTIGRSRLTASERSERRAEGRGKRDAPRREARTQVVKATAVPAGSRFKGYQDFIVQELLIQAQTGIDWRSGGRRWGGW